MKTGSKKPYDWKRDMKGSVYLDASALAKLYLPEPESEMLEHALENRRDLVLSDLTITETISALCRLSREGTVDDESKTRLYRAIVTDFESNLFLHVGLASPVHREAERLLLSVSISLRSLASLHLALALTAGAQTVVTFDHRLANAARTIGLNSFP